MEWIRHLFARKRPTSTPQQMIGYLLDKSGDLGSRDDIAMDLSESDLPEVEAALIQIATDHSEEEMIIDSAGESLWEIWLRQKRTADPVVLARMHPSARKFFAK